MENTEQLSIALHDEIQLPKSSYRKILYFIKKGADINYIDQYNNTALDYATNYDKTKLVELLLNNGAKIRNNKPQSLLSVAASNDNLPLVKILLNNGSIPADQRFFTNIELDSKVFRFVTRYDIQKKMLKKYPMIYNEFKNKKFLNRKILNILHPRIKQEYAFLDKGIELGLL